MDRLGDPAVGAVCSDNCVDGQRPPGLVHRVVHDVRRVVGGGDFEIRDQSLDEIRAVGHSAGAEIRIQYLAAHHGDELARLQGFPEIDGQVRWGDDFHVGDFPVDQLDRNVELVEHAEGDGAAAGLGCGRVALE